MPHAAGKATTIDNYLFNPPAPALDDLKSGGRDRVHSIGQVRD